MCAFIAIWRRKVEVAVTNPHLRAFPRAASKGFTARAVLVDLPARAAQGEPIPLDAIEDDFFRRLKLANGTYKTTSRRRLDDVDAAFASALKACDARPTDFLDVSASSGVTSLDWLNSLEASGIRPQMMVSDLSLSAFLVSPCSWFVALVDRRNSPLEFEVFARTVRARVKKVDLLTGKFLLILAARLFYRAFSRTSRLDGDNCAPGARPGNVRPVPLLAHDVRSCGRISYFDDDITAPNSSALIGRFDVVRAANILHRVYFDDATIQRAVRTLKDRLRGDGSWLIVCRTNDDGSNHASLFRIEHGRPVVKARVGKGSEIENLVLASMHP